MAEPLFKVNVDHRAITRAQRVLNRYPAALLDALEEGMQAIAPKCRRRLS